jgi:hypothetical protein
VKDVWAIVISVILGLLLVWTALAIMLLILGRRRSGGGRLRRTAEEDSFRVGA